MIDFKNLVDFSLIHIYISYANIAWATTFKTKPQGILKKQKYAARTTFHGNRFDHSIINIDEGFKCLSNQLDSNSKIAQNNTKLNME